MILPFVAELLGRVARHPAVEATLEELRSRLGSVAAVAVPAAAQLETGGRVSLSEVREEESRGMHPDLLFRLAGLTDTAKALLAAQAGVALSRPVILLVASNERAEALAEPLRFFYRALTGKPAWQVTVLPAHDVLPYEGQSPHAEISVARGVALWRFTTGVAPVLVVPIASALLRLHEMDFYRSLARELARDQDVPLENLAEHLAEVGYERVEMVEMAGQYAVRGGIVDVFSPEALRPVRIELFGDQVESLREFDPATQRSVGPLERVTLLPMTDCPQRRAQLVPPGADGAASGSATGDAALMTPGWEFELARSNPAASSLLDWNGERLIVLEEPQILEEEARKFLEHLKRSYEEASDDASDGAGQTGVPEPSIYYLSENEWQRALETRPRLALEQLAMEGAGNLRVLPTQPTLRYHGNLPAFMAEARGHLRAGEQVVLSAASIGELERLTDLCHEYEVPYRLGELEEDLTISRLAQDSSAGSVPALVLVKAPLAEGVAFPDLRLVLHGNADLFEVVPEAERPRRRRKAAAFASDFSDLKPGDFVVHLDHGIGEFEGLRQIAVDGTQGEFMLLRYADDARLYVPVARLDLVQKYRALGGTRPVLDKLGGSTWVARKTRVRKSVDDMAHKLLRLYSERKSSPGYAFPPDSTWQKELEDAFEFDETPDQARAIEDVKRDLEAALPMDRLLCGDVGYGKTEVALRAAFKVVSDSKQVAVLAPTTVLVYQHYQTFRSRLAAFPLRVEMLSRFRNATEQKKTLEDLEAGKVDIVVGTHRLLSRDIKFHDLGLLVVDEEQRFGVAHKERLKEMRLNVDVLTMSATPIPRTLHMGLVGLRDMSLIETPPKDRLAIQTIVAPFEERLVQRAIEEELARQGQVYFVHNRVESISSVAGLVQRLVPRARVVVGHGQMQEKQLEQVMMKFIQHEADVLVSTSIIENGLDIPRANTIIINRADRFGLADLYQLRGRVGRSNQRAYAYLLVPPQAALSSTARQRLAALKEFSDLGAGFRIAALDLELRGAGNLLGREQHGHVNAVGFDLYCQMLERAITERKGEGARPELRVTLNLGLDIRIPPQYISSENIRLRTYKRIAAVGSDAEREEVLKELEDRFGPPPPAVVNLLDYAVLKALCEKLLVAAVERRGELLALKFYPETPVRPAQVVEVVGRRRGLRLDPGGVLWMEWKREAGTPAQGARNVLLQLQT